MMTLNYDEIARVAWGLWQAEGCPQGRDQEHWLKAEQQLLAAKNGQNGKPLDSTAQPKVSARRRRSGARQAAR